MAHFLNVVLQIEPPIPPMVCHPLPPRHFYPSVPPDCTSPWNQVGHIWVVCRIWVNGYLCQSVIKISG